ncbi:hypothetical protein LSH36_186g03040 [Paralvinella palmiformis]|uniref:Uncharacterized protein n=1 Tax=Paralvinella palmiformis TaxID=53620 RepID=A0AAD9JRN7_9ANNE|nr:hypothetical protein LSH36_186g03040 [Paralvinella palmiformis]
MVTTELTGMDSLYNIDAWYKDPNTAQVDVMGSYHPRDSTTWSIFNLTGELALCLALFLMAVLCPIAYVTFCCRRPSSGDRCLYGSYCSKLTGLFWLDRHPTDREGATDAENPAQIATLSRNGVPDPPTYLVALAMPKPDRTISGTPPPTYDKLDTTAPILPDECSSSNRASGLGEVPERGDASPSHDGLVLNASGLRLLARADVYDLSASTPGGCCDTYDEASSCGDEMVVSYTSSPVTDFLPSYDESLLLLKAANSSMASEQKNT